MESDETSDRLSSTNRKNGGKSIKTTCRSMNLLDCFARAEKEIDCVVCGKKFKEGLRQSHKKYCRMTVDDDDVTFLEEVKKTSGSATTTQNPRRSSRKRGIKRKMEPDDDDSDVEYIPTQSTSTRTEEIDFTQPKYDLWSSKRLRARQQTPIDQPIAQDHRESPPIDVESAPPPRSSTPDPLISTKPKKTTRASAKQFAEDNHRPSTSGTIFDNSQDLFQTYSFTDSESNDETDVPTTSTAAPKSKVPTIDSVRSLAAEEPSTSTVCILHQSPDDEIPFHGFDDDEEFNIRPTEFGSQDDEEVAEEQPEIHHGDEILDQEDDEEEILNENLSVVLIENSQSSSAKPKFIPFLTNAITDIFKRISSDEFHAHLFNDKDRRTFGAFFGLSDDAKTLYCRFMTRKMDWHTGEALEKKYSSDLRVVEALNDLCRVSLLKKGDALNDLSEVFALMQAAQLQALAKKFLPSKECQTTKVLLIEKLRTHARTQKSLGESMEAVILKRAKKEIGECFSLVDESYLVLLSAFHLFSPSEMVSSKAADGQVTSCAKLINGLIQVLRQAKNDEIQFVTRTGVRKMHQFQSREDMHQYVRASMLELHVLEQFTKKNYQECESFGARALQEVKTELEDPRKYLKTPSQFRRYTMPWVLFRILDRGLAALERQRKYEQAVEQLRETIELSTGHWCPKIRSGWYERLALILEKHLKRPEEAAKVCEKALRDEEVAEDVRRSLFERGKRILESLIEKAPSGRVKAALKRRLSALKKLAPRMVDVPEHTIDAELLKKALGGRLKTIFASTNDEDGSVTARNVEAVARAHYIEHGGYQEGIHAEGSPWLTLFGLFFWDIIHDSDVPDSYVCSQQWCPLDLNDLQFYARRRPKVDEKLKWIAKSPATALLEALRETWDAHQGKASQLVNWNVFTDFEQMERFLICIDARILSKIFQRLASDHRQYRSGFPDLLLWNSERKTFKVVEVKGPGDSLSMKQRIWLEFFVGINAAAEICWVKGVSGKRIRKEENI